jgi:hypothetical protein
MSATVIEAACIGLLIISECIICVVQCCTLLSERFIDTFCFCLNRASALSFCLLSKYSMKLYCNRIKDLICCSVSFDCHKVFQIFVICTNLKTWHTSQFCLTLSSIVWWSASLYHKSHNCTLQMHSSLNSRHRVFTHHSLTATEFHLCINLRNLFSSCHTCVWSNRTKISTEMNIVFSFLKPWSAFSVHLKDVFFCMRVIIDIIRLEKFLMNFQ